jgi:peptidoglycan/xylan/chitin deacetylase (PgdA/CDA1 family)
MPGGSVALRLDDVGAASKRHEVYGVTRLSLGVVRVPFPGNLLFLKYVPPIKRWGPYRELRASEWERVLRALESTGSRMTVGITAGWVERDGHIVPFPRKFPDAASVIREGARRGLLEVANHGYTHCVLTDGKFRPRAFSGNRSWHREFYDWLPPATHGQHLSRAQNILGEYFGAAPLTFIPPGNVFARATLEAAAAVGIRYLSCRDASRHGSIDGITPVDDAAVVAIHDRDVVLGGLARFGDMLSRNGRPPFVTVREMAEAAARTPR